jgi:hypothetical protein
VDHKVIIKVGDYQIPGAWKAYGNILWEYIDAIDAEDELAPYRFQKVGERWVTHFTVDGVVKRGDFNDYRGLQHYAQSLAAPHRKINCIELAGLANTETLDTIERERHYSSIERNDPKAVATYKAAIRLLEDKKEAARLSGDMMEMERLGDQRDQLVNVLWPGKAKADQKRTKLNFKTLGRQTLGKSKTARKIQSTVRTAMSRAIETLRDGKMDELAHFLEMTVVAEGDGFAYRPVTPEPDWLL